MSSSGRHSDRRRVEGQLSGACQSLRYALAKERSGLRSGVLKSYSRYYNKVRTHRSLDKDAPISRPVQRAGSTPHTPSSVDSITTTSASEFSVHTGISNASNGESRPDANAPGSPVG